MMELFDSAAGAGRGRHSMGVNQGTTSESDQEVQQNPFENNQSSAEDNEAVEMPTGNR